MQTFPDKLVKARYHCAEKFPYLRAILYRLEPGTTFHENAYLAVDSDWRLYWNTELLERVNNDQMIGLLTHEIMHLLHDHFGRLKGVQKHIALVGSDLAVNSLVRHLHVDLPEVLFPEQYNLPPLLSAEEYCQKLESRDEFKLPQSRCCGSDKDPNQTPNKTCGGGSGATGRREHWELPPKAGRRLSEIEKTLVRQQVAQAVLEHAKTIGNVPGELKRWAESVVHPPQNWRQILSHAIRSGMRVRGYEYSTYQKLPRRIGMYLHIGVLKPGHYACHPIVGIVCDTSGSVSEKELGIVQNELTALLQRLSFKEVIVSCADVKLYKTRTYDRASIRKMEFYGGGGTDIQAAAEKFTEKYPVDILIVISDGYTQWETRRPKRARHIVYVQLGTQNINAPVWADKVVPIDTREVQA